MITLMAFIVWYLVLNKDEDYKFIFIITAVIDGIFLWICVGQFLHDLTTQKF